MAATEERSEERGAEGRNVGRTEARKIALQKLAQVGLGPEVGELRPSELSGGMQKRVALACGGLVVSGRPPFVVARDREQWVRALLSLWGDEDLRRRLGGEARRLVIRQHSWAAAAVRAAAGLEHSRRPAGR